MATPPDFSVGQVLTAAHMNAVGLWRVTTCTVTSAGGTAATASNGVISIGTNNTSITVASAFSADFDNYRVIINGDTVTSVGNYTLAFSGITGAGLHRQVGYYQSYGASGITAYAADSTTIIAGHATTSGYSSVIDIQNPYKTEITTGIAQASSTTTMYSFPFVINSTTSTTGFVLSGVTFTGGTIRVYGYRN